MAADNEHEKVAVLGLGHVGLPLTLALSRAGFDTLGFDTDARHVADLQQNHDKNGEVSGESLRASQARFSATPQDLGDRTTYIIAVPTPITDAKTPDLGPLRGACGVIAPYLVADDLVVVESTVYPGMTEDVCGPALAAGSGLRVGEHSMENVIKIISAQDGETLDRVETIYGAGVHRASSIMTAKAAKAIENTPRDLNKTLLARKVDLSQARVLGFAFKDNCADIRNTRASDTPSELAAFSVAADRFAPSVDPETVTTEYGITPIAAPQPGAYDAIIVAVAHNEFVEMGGDTIRLLGKPGAVLYDIKGIFGKSGSDLRL